MKVNILLPSVAEAPWVERVTYFAGRRARTLKDHDGLLTEIEQAPRAKMAKFLNSVLNIEWALDVAEMAHFVFDIEEAPSWMTMELFRHRILARDWSPEQRSKRAIAGHRIPVINPFNSDSKLWTDFEELTRLSQDLMQEASNSGIGPGVFRYATLEGAETAFCVAGNARALRDMIAQRGPGTAAAPEIQDMATQMAALAYARCPLILGPILPQAMLEAIGAPERVT